VLNRFSCYIGRIIFGVVCTLATSLCMATPLISSSTDRHEGGARLCDIYTCALMFVPKVDITTYALGAWDLNSAGLSNPGSVGLWSEGGELLSETTIANGTDADLIEFYRYNSTGPVELIAGSTYLLGAYGMGTTLTAADFRDFSLSDFSSDVTITGSRYDLGSEMAFPTNFSTFVYGGASFQFERTSSIVPLPDTLVLAFIGLLAGCLCRARPKIE